MSDSSSNYEDNKEEVIEEVQDKFIGYKCDRCGYTSRRLKPFISHVTRKVPCFVVKNYNYGVQKAIEQYEKKSKIVLEMLDQLENNEEVDLNKLIKYVTEIERLGRVHPNYKQEDVDEIKEIIKENQK
jgi:hypothetical protein